MVHAATGRLFTVAESGVEYGNADVIHSHGDPLNAVLIYGTGMRG
jgi:hypothetical protein